MHYYSGLLKRTLKEAYAYKLNFFFSFLVTFIPIIGFLFLVNYIYSSNNSIANYTLEKAITYYIFVRFFSDIFSPVSWWDITNDIRSGDLNFHIMKPYSYFWHNFVIFYFLKIIYFIVSLPIGIILIFILNKSIYFPIEIVTYLIFPAFILLALVLSFQMTFLISISSFWLIDNSFVINLLFLLFPFLMGTLLPLNVYPIIIQNILNYLPFSYLIFAPSQIFLENYDLNYVLHSFIIVSLWIIIFYFAIKILFLKGLKKYEANG